MYDRLKLEELRLSLEKWEETTLGGYLARLPERQAQFITASSEPVERLYTPLDVAGMDYRGGLGLPGGYPDARGGFGKGCAAVASLKDMEILLDGSPLNKVSTSMTINSPAAIVWAMYIAAAEKQGDRKSTRLHSS